MYENRKNDQRGMAHLLLVVVAAVVIGVAVFAGMKVMSSNKDKSTSKSSATGIVANKEVADACNKELHDKDLCKFASNYKLDGVSYEVVITNTQDGKTSTTTMQLDSKSNSSMVTSEGGHETGAYISLNNAIYNKDQSSGTWTKFSTAASSTTPTETKPSDDIGIKASDLSENNTITYKNLGKEACGKLTCLKYQMIDSQNPGTTQYIWFDTKDYAMRHWYSKDATATTDMVINYKSVNIKEPSPVQDYSAQSDAATQAAAAQAAAAASAAIDYGSDDNQE